MLTPPSTPPSTGLPKERQHPALYARLRSLPRLSAKDQQKKRAREINQQEDAAQAALGLLPQAEVRRAAEGGLFTGRESKSKEARREMEAAKYNAEEELLYTKVHHITYGPPPSHPPAPPG